MKRCLFVFLPALFTGIIAHCQLINNGATITVQSGATIKCSGSIVNKGTIQNSGTVSSDGELRNEVGGTLSNNAVGSLYEASTKFVNYGNSFKNINLRLIGNTNTDSIKSGVGSTYLNVNLAKGVGATASLSDAMLVKGGFSFENDNNQLVLGDQAITMDSVATFQNPDNNQFVVTNGAGAVVRTNLATTAFVYPVGFSATEFNPLTISNSGTPDDISVRCQQNVQANGTSGSVVTTHFVNNSWVVNEGIANGSNLTLTGQWVGTDEPAGFNRLKSGIARYNTLLDWDLPASNVIAASGSNPFLRTRTGITSTGVFAIADLERVNTAKMNLKVFLQGAYNASTGLMNDLLRDDPSTGAIDPVIPTTQPYNTALDPKFARVGIYDGSGTVNETINPSIFSVTGNDAIVDWVYVSTLDPTTPSIKLQTRAALLQRDGDIVDLDGVSPLSLPIDADGNYNILISHRNHLTIRTAAPLALADNAVPLQYYFTTGQAQAFQDGTILTNAAMAQNGSAFLMWAGNANLDSYVRVIAQGIPPIPSDVSYMLGIILSGNPNGTISGYTIGDINMDRKMRVTALGIPPVPSDASFMLGIPLNGVPNATRKEHK
ncbi:MAG: hypothetical protein E6H09_15710 [Bacteroidetes bacterium]|jgi:hypothetical protein|nr:MAG: hypothetical protein E6H09_15710 [Bacteroidota bacterium]